MKNLGYASFVTLTTLLAGFGMWLKAFDVSAVAGIAVITLAFFLAAFMPKYLNIVRSANKQSTLLLDSLIGLSACGMMLSFFPTVPWTDVVGVAMLCFVVADASVWFLYGKRPTKIHKTEVVPCFVESVVVIAWAVWMALEYIDGNSIVVLIALCALLVSTVLLALSVCVSIVRKKEGYYKEMRLGLSLDVVLGCFLIYDLFTHGVYDVMYSLLVLVLLLADGIRYVVSKIVKVETLK